MPRRSSRPQKPPPGSAFDVGLRLLARRPHSRAEIRMKLGRRGYGAEEVDAALGRLIQLGYLDDRAYAAGHVRRRLGGRGPLALRSELAARGVGRTLIDEAVAALDPEAQLESARRLAGRLAGGKTFAGYKELLDGVGPKLVRRGFSPGIARAACHDLWITATTNTSDPSGA